MWPDGLCGFEQFLATNARLVPYGILPVNFVQSQRTMCCDFRMLVFTGTIRNCRVQLARQKREIPDGMQQPISLLFGKFRFRFDGSRPLFFHLSFNCITSDSDASPHLRHAPVAQRIRGIPEKLGCIFYRKVAVQYFRTSLQHPNASVAHQRYQRFRSENSTRRIVDLPLEYATTSVKLRLRFETSHVLDSSLDRDFAGHARFHTSRGRNQTDKHREIEAAA